MTSLREHYGFVLQGPILEMKSHPAGNLTAMAYLDRVAAGDN